MKKIVMIGFAAVLLSLISVRVSNACSPAFWYVEWPHPDQTEVPLNAELKIMSHNGDTITVNLVNENNNSNIELNRTDLDGGYILLKPAKPLLSNTNYKIVLHTSLKGYKDYETKFTTGSITDNEPPIIDKGKITAEIDWATENSEVDYFMGCFYNEYDVEEFTKIFGENSLKYVDYLPEHYHVIVKVPEDAVDEATGNVKFTLFSVDKSDNEKQLFEVNQWTGYDGPIQSNRLLPEEVESIKLFRIKMEDALGHKQDETVEVSVNFNKGESTFSISGGAGGGGDDDNNDDDEVASAASAGCSNVPAKGGASNAAVIIVLMAVIESVFLVVRRRALLS